MKPAIQLQIPKPCHENWNNMHPTEQGRFCLSCQKEVVDFSLMTDKEILNYISKASSNICGRIAESQLNRELIVVSEQRRFGLKYWLGIAAYLLIMTSKSNAQIKPPKERTVYAPPDFKRSNQPEKIVIAGAVSTINKKLVEMQIQGRIADENNNPVPYASIRFKDTDTGVAADSVGHFILTVNNNTMFSELEISSVGYETKLINISKAENINSIKYESSSFRIELSKIQLNQVTLGEVVVKSGSLQGRMALAGGLVVCHKPTLFEKAKNKWKELVTNKELKVFPNPIEMNRNFRVEFNLKDPGEYSNQFMDLSGKLIAEKKLNINVKNQLENFDSNIFSSRGVYFMRVTGKQNKIYSTKLVSQ